MKEGLKYIYYKIEYFNVSIMIHKAGEDYITDSKVTDN